MMPRQPMPKRPNNHLASRRPHIRCLLPRLAIVSSIAFAASPASAETLAESRLELTARYAAQLAELATWCEKLGLAEEAMTARGWPLPQAPLTLVVPLVGKGADKPPEAEVVPAKAAEWGERFTQLRQAQGEALFELARREAGEKQTALAYRLVHETLREDPRHEAARKLLGYKLHDGRWLTPYEVQKAQGNQVWHEKFGWLLKAQLERYEAGERYYKRRWIKADEEAKLRTKIEQGWDVVTEHFQVHTNHSLEEGVRLATRLERLHQVWRQLFVRFYLVDEQIAKLFKGGAPPKGPLKRHQVTYFRNRDEYNLALIARQPNIGITTGYYEPGSRTAYFFAGEEQDDSNLYHEATHQLFSEIRKTSPETGREANFWIVEGIACYMESFTLGGGDSYCRLGGVDATRLQNARARLLQDDFYMPLAELNRMGKNDLQRDERIKNLYSQASGMTYFLIEAGDGRYRDALVDYLAAIYTNHDTPDTLAELTGRSYGELDREYREFLKAAKESDAKEELGDRSQEPE